VVKLDLPHTRRTSAGRRRLSLGDWGRLILVMVLWALCYPLITTGLTMAPPFIFATLRSFVAGTSLLLLAFVLRRPLPQGWKTWLSLLMVGLSTTSMGFTGMFLAGGLVSPGLATVLANAQPLIAAVLAYFVLGERLRVAHRLCLALGFAGILLIALPHFGRGNAGNTPAGIGYILIGALGVAVGNVVLKRLARSRTEGGPTQIDPLMATGWQFLLGSVPLWLAAQTLETPQPVRWSLSFVAVLLALGLLGTALAFALWFSLLRRGGLTRLNTFTFLTPVIALVIGVLFYAESLRLVELAGIALTLAGATWVTRG